MASIGTSLLAEEVRVWNTPLYGGFLLWGFSKSYCKNHPNGEAPSGLLHFIALPMLASPALNFNISERRKNLQSYVQGFEDGKKSDVLLSLHDRIKARRENALQSIDAAIFAGLLSWDAASGKLYPHDLKKKPARGRALRASALQDKRKSEILGRWFSEHDVSTIASYLRVVL